jgi:hypothetical protein
MKGLLPLARWIAMDVEIECQVFSAGTKVVITKKL